MKIGVLSYAYNQQHFIGQGLKSILSQVLPPDCEAELLVIDDDSTDNTFDVISKTLDDELLARHPSWRVSIRGHKTEGNLGQSATLKEGLSLVNGDFIFVLEGDDFWITKNHLINLTGLLQKYEFASAAFSSWICLDEEQNLKEARLAPSPFSLASNLVSYDTLLRFNTPGTLSCCAFRSTALQESFDFINSQKEIADWGINLKLSLSGPILWHDEISAVYRQVRGSSWHKHSAAVKASIASGLLLTYSEWFPNEARKKAIDLIRRRGLNQKYSRTLSRLHAEWLGTLMRFIRGILKR